MGAWPALAVQPLSLGQLGERYRRIIVQVETLEGRLLDAYVYVPAASPPRDPSPVPA